MNALKKFGDTPSGKIMTQGTVCVHGKSLFVACHGVRKVLTPIPFGNHQSRDNKRKVKVCLAIEWIVVKLNRGAFFLVKFLDLTGSSMSKCSILITFPNHLPCL